MENKKVLILYFSFHHKNTEKVARAIAEVLKADLIEITKAEPEVIFNYDLIGFGSGIYALSHHKLIFDFLKKLNKVQKKAFIFSTSGAPKGEIFHKKLKKELIKKGFEIIGEFNCPGFDSFGPFKIFGRINKGRPNELDIQKARELAKNLMK